MEGEAHDNNPLIDRIPADSLGPEIAPGEENGNIIATQPDYPYWMRIRELFENESVIFVSVVGFNQGGALVKGREVTGFVPSSHLLSLPPGIRQKEKRRLLADLIGKRLSVRVIEWDPAQDRIVLSERAARSKSGNRKRILKTLKPGDRVSGVVTNITSFGIFIDLGGVEGLVHVSELSWGKVSNPAGLVSPGQLVELVVTEIFVEKSHVALSMKRLCPNPWEILASRIKLGDVVPAVITRICGFGVFALLDEYGIEGLIHQSSLIGLEPPGNFANLFQVNQPVKVTILQLDPEKCRLGLGLVR